MSLREVGQFVQTQVGKDMISRLSSGVLEQLVPLLGGLARLVAQSSSLSDVQLKTLLLGAGLENDTVALEELKRWARLLAALHERPAELREATMEALMLRGLPEAPVLLAVATVATGAGQCHENRNA